MYQLSESYEPRDTETVNEPIIPEVNFLKCMTFPTALIIFNCHALKYCFFSFHLRALFWQIHQIFLSIIPCKKSRRPLIYEIRRSLGVWINLIKFIQTLDSLHWYLSICILYIRAQFNENPLWWISSLFISYRIPTQINKSFLYSQNVLHF